MNNPLIVVAIIGLIFTPTSNPILFLIFSGLLLWCIHMPYKPGDRGND